MMRRLFVLLIVFMAGCAQATPTAVPSPTPDNQPRGSRIDPMDTHSSTPSFYASTLPTRTPVPTIPPLPTADESGIARYIPAIDVGDFMLTDQDGEMIHIDYLQGRYVLLTFGYTHCPDICPLTLAHFKRIKTLMGEQADGITFLFITVDGARDTPERLKEYIGMFDAGFIGMTGEDVLVRDVITRFRGDYSIENAGGLLREYPVNHTTGMYLLNPQGEWIQTYLYGTQPNVVAQDLLRLLTG